ncbi:MAG: hypothetical protein II776_01525 [Clostridia bacterium]|nr:hypothetical protein [Clostridia bacterium]
MSFIGRGKGLIFKTFLYQVVMSFFGIMMYTATFRNTALMVIGTVMVIAFYLFIFFRQSMQAGSKECEYGIAHRSNTSPWSGCLLVLLGFLPMIALSVWSVFQPPYLADGSSGAAIVPFTVNKVLQQGVYQGVYQMLWPTVSGDAGVGPANAAALNHQALLFPFAFLPGWIAGSAGYAVGWNRFKMDKKEMKMKIREQEDERSAGGN